MDRDSDVLGKGCGSVVGRDRGRSRGPEPGGLAIGGGSGPGGESVAVAVAARPQDRLSLAPQTRDPKAAAVPESAGESLGRSHLNSQLAVTRFFTGRRSFRRYVIPSGRV